MVELLEERLEGGLELGEIHDPAERGIGLAGHVQLDVEGMPMQARTLVPGGHVRQTMGGLDLETLEDAHGRPL
jgi:hypothetical protein